MPEAAGAEGYETLLAFDFGTRKIGIAIGNTLIRQARPLEILTPPTRAARFARVSELIQEWRPDRLVVGLPLASDGSEQYATLQARRFANQLRGRYGLPVELVDERGSSIQAQEMLPRNAPDDALAAAIILQRYFDSLAPRPVLSPHEP